MPCIYHTFFVRFMQKGLLGLLGVQVLLQCWLDQMHPLLSKVNAGELTWLMFMTFTSPILQVNIRFVLLLSCYYVVFSLGHILCSWTSAFFPILIFTLEFIVDILFHNLCKLPWFAIVFGLQFSYYLLDLEKFTLTTDILFSNLYPQLVEANLFSALFLCTSIF